jgi:hypothetical protein
LSFSFTQSREFFGPLEGKVVTFMLKDRNDNMSFARGLVSLVSQTRDKCFILDIDALYASNAREIFSLLSDDQARSIRINVPEVGSRMEDEFPKALEGGSRTVIVDSLNSLHHLFSLDDHGSRSRKLSFAVASLSYAAKVSGSAAILSMYRRDGFTMTLAKGSMSGLADATVSVETHGSELEMDCERGKLWPGASFSIRIPSGLPG